MSYRRRRRTHKPTHKYIHTTLLLHVQTSNFFPVQELPHFIPASTTTVTTVTEAAITVATLTMALVSQPLLPLTSLSLIPPLFQRTTASCLRHCYYHIAAVVTVVIVAFPYPCFNAQLPLRKIFTLPFLVPYTIPTPGRGWN